jgi:hypothetical protein
MPIIRAVFNQGIDLMVALAEHGPQPGEEYRSEQGGRLEYAEDPLRAAAWWNCCRRHSPPAAGTRSFQQTLGPDAEARPRSHDLPKGKPVP